MARHLTLSEEQKRILRIRVHLSRSLGLFYIEQIADEWNISNATLYRYDSPTYRASSRTYPRLSYERSKMLPKGKCYRCGDDTANHHRCAGCTVLLHSPYVYCESCVDARLRKYLYV